MRFLGIGKDGSLGDMYLNLSRAGHEVKAYIGTPEWHGTLAGLIQRTDDWKQELDWIREDEGIVIFEAADHGELQDSLRRDGFHVIGGSALGDRMENDRDYGQSCMRQAGMQTAVSRDFHDFGQAIAYIRSRPRRYVLKLSGLGHSSSSNVVGEMDGGEDISALLERHLKTWSLGDPPHFILMDHVTGVEVGVGGYFNGEEFLDAVVIDWEHKKFFTGDMGELTGEMGTLLSYRNSRPLFDATLAKMTEQLRSGGYVGYINLNTIVNADGIWPLEFTCRFGYPGAAICSTLHREGWDVLFARMIARDRPDFATASGFAAGVVLTVPPFPQCDDYSELSKGLPILFRQAPTAQDEAHFHMSEVELRDGQLITTGGTGSLMAVTGTGDTVETACEQAYARCANIVVPNLRYRKDIGARFLARDRALMQEWGLWPASH
jgi:phosphoribosylamine--glycine ligase